MFRGESNASDMSIASPGQSCVTVLKLCSLIDRVSLVSITVVVSFPQWLVSRCFEPSLNVTEFCSERRTVLGKVDGLTAYGEVSEV